MEDQIRNTIKADAIAKMRYPTILMNDEDFKKWKKQVEYECTMKITDNPTFEGIPIETQWWVPKNKFIVYDNTLKKQLWEK